MYFINEQHINELLKEAKGTSSKEVSRIIAKALLLKGLSIKETAILLQCTDKTLIAKIFKAAEKVKEEIYGKRLVLFAPLYLSNDCTNNCLYCAFRSGNKELERKTLSLEEIKRETVALLKEGHKRLLLVAGEHPRYANIEYLEKAVKLIYKTKVRKDQIRRINVNAAPMSVPDFKRLKNTGIGTFQLFQETYHYDTYKTMHPSGPKADYEWRLYGMDRAQEAGINDVGVGVLFGLYDYKSEVLALMQHITHLEKTCGVGPHTISVPRLEPALGSSISYAPPYPVSDDDFKKIVAILRLAVPYTGIILSTRESAAFRNEVINLGISQISAGSKTDPGGYTQQNKQAKASQFTLYDLRSLDEVIRDISEMGYIPSFCTACYRLGRTGKDFMDLAKPGLIKEFCLPNALLTFKEYLIDHATKETKKSGNRVILKQIREAVSPKRRRVIEQKIKRLEEGKRDLYF
ncbi:MAG: [FeFe] hydrogenase H-cluster radical SAM maturase HydG [Candidatus Saganbacteria bacterium]|nr:[FeFe] hydrogenase H-cluster radical SAM maturase HydG [Candidatus Saganbacteria bacterium]